MITVSEAIAEELHRAGVDRTFGLPGGEVLYLIDALREIGIEFTLCRHEADAGIAAAVYGKLKRTPGVVITTLGPGASNLMLPFSNSVLDREPLLAISAQIPESWPATHTHQRIPFIDCYRPVTKFASAVNGHTARRTIRRALELAIEEPAGPTYVTISTEQAIAAGLEFDDSREAFNPHQAKATGSHGDPVAAARALRERLSTAERPLVLLGIGVDPIHAPQIRRWLDNWGLDVGVTPKIKGIVDETASNFIGVVGGMSIDGTILEALHESDLIVSFGFDPVEVDKTWHAELPISWVLEAPLAMGIVPTKDCFFASHGEILEHLIAMGAPKSWDPSFEDTKAKRRACWEQSRVDEPDLSHHPVSIVRALAEAVPAETIVTTDVGSHKYLFGQFWTSRQPETFFMSNGLSGMGYGIAAALGAKLARPNVPVLAAVGDGGFSMNSQELETAVRVGAPIIVLVLADSSYSLIHHSQLDKKLPNYGVDFNPIDSVKIAEACGVKGLRARDAATLAEAVMEAIAGDQSLVVEVPVEIDAYQGLV